jgi:hypothetical protein
VGCHLCDEAEAELNRLQPRYAHTLERIDIDTDAELMRRYGEQIPVLVMREREYAAPLTREVIEHALAEAAAPGHRPRLGRLNPWSQRARGK